LNKKRVANCSEEHFLLHGIDLFLRDDLHRKKLSVGDVATL
jgi:hypothetical protein